MAVNGIFATKLALVVGAPAIAYVTNDVTHGEFEFSYSYSGGTYTVRGNSEIACEQGAASLLRALGFRFYAPHRNFHIIPAGPLATNLTATKQKMWMFANTFTQTYGHSFPAPWASSKGVLDTNVVAWSVLNGWRYGSAGVLPNGHRWSGIIRTSAKGPPRQFFIDNPQMLISGDLDSFDLANIRPGSPNYDLLTTYCAARLLTEGFSDYGGTNFDPSDGDSNNSNDVFQFSIDVCIKCRAGTPAMPAYGLSARAGVPNARLGVYSYADHKNAPSFSMKPYIYVGIALGFSPKTTWLPRMQQFNGLCDFIMTRDYHDTHTWSYGRPLVNSKMKRGYADTYDDYKAAGCVGCHTEGSGNWLVNLVAMWQFSNKLFVGAYDFDDARNDVVADLFGDDPKVHELYDYWSDPFNNFHEFSLEHSMNIVDQMGEGTLYDGTKYKDMFKWVMTIVYEYLTLPPKPDLGTVGDAYDVALSKLLGHCTAVRDYDITHSYAWLRRLGRGNVSSSHPWLRFEVDPKPAYYTSPTVPTNTDFQNARAALAATNFRTSGIDPADPADLIYMKNLPVPAGVSSATAATAFKMRGGAIYYFVGPGEVTLSGTIFLPTGDSEDVIEVPYQDPPIVYGAGLHVLNIDAWVTVTWTGGRMFWKAFPDVLKETALAGNYGAYVPTRCRDIVRVKAESNLRLVDAQGAKNFGLSAKGINQSVGPGVVKMEDNTSSAILALVNMNPYVSSKITENLMSSTVAAEDFPARFTVSKV